MLDPTLQKKYEQARALMRREDYARALPLLDSLNHALPHKPDIIAAKAVCLTKLLRLDEARREANKLITMHQDPRGRQLRGWIQDVENFHSGMPESDTVHEDAPKAPTLSRATGEETPGKRTMMLAGTVLGLVFAVLVLLVLIVQGLDQSTPAPSATVIQDEGGIDVELSPEDLPAYAE